MRRSTHFQAAHSLGMVMVYTLLAFALAKVMQWIGGGPIDTTRAVAIFALVVAVGEQTKRRFP